MKDIKCMYIRPAHMDEVISILSEWQIATKLSRPVLECIGREHNYTLVVVNDYRLLVSFRHTSSKAKGVVEVHIACPRSSIVASRFLAMLTMKWLIEDTTINASKLVVYAPKGRMSNFARRVGFIEDDSIKCKSGELAFTYSKFNISI